MGYVAVQGGGLAIEESLSLLEYERVCAAKNVGTADIESAFPELIDQVMGEASLYAPRLAALALKQAQGSPDEAVFLLRAFRSTLERPYVSRVLDTEGMQVRRRISAAFKDVPGGQVLGATRDYSHRLLDFDLATEDAQEQRLKRADLERHFAAYVSNAQGGELGDKPTAGAAGPSGDGAANPLAAPASPCGGEAGGAYPRVLDYLRGQGLVDPVRADATPPEDATMSPLTFPASRSVRLQTLSRGMTQAVEALGYAAIRGFGPSHPTVGELRAGKVAVAIDHPAASGACDPQDAYYVGSVPVTEVESVFAGETTGDQGARMVFDVGYGLVMGRAETKAIAMSVLDHCLEHGEGKFPTEDEEFVLYHVDGVEATGFISHLKLPHYVTFQSKLSSARGTTAAQEPKEADDAAAL